jgi:two-component system cell cycle response regulator CpdR
MADILVVDDEEAIRSMLVSWFADKGHSVAEAPDGLAAEAMIFTRHYDLLISDIMMPNMDGLELLRRVKFMNPAIKFIAITGFHKPENIPVCLEHNVSRYVRKPFHMEEIDAVVEEVLGEKEVLRVKRAAVNGEGWFETDLYSSEESLLVMHNCMGHYLSGFLAEPEARKISLAFYEMIRNAIEWGNCLNRELLVSVSCMISEGRVIFKIEDQGKGFDFLAALSPEADAVKRQKDRMSAGKRPGGYGIELARKCMDKVCYLENGRCVILAKDIDKLSRKPVNLSHAPIRHTPSSPAGGRL